MFERNVVLLVITSIVAAFAYVAKEGSTHNWNIKYPKVYSIAKRMFIPAYIIIFFITIGFTVADNISNEDLKTSINKLNTKADSIQNVSDSSAHHDLKIIRHIAERTDSLLKPFALLAAKKYPKIDSTQALNKLYRDITINVKNETIIAPKAQIATIGQIGNNIIVSTIPDVNVIQNWLSTNKKTDSIRIMNRKPEVLPTKELPYNVLYEHEFELSYTSKYNLNSATVIIHDKNVVYVNSYYKGITNWKNIKYTRGQYFGYSGVIFTQPSNGKYKIKFYTTTKLITFPIIKVIN